MKKISIIVPVYYNQDNLLPLYVDLKEKVLMKLNMEYEIIISETCIEEIDENIFFKKVFFYCKKRT